MLVFTAETDTKHVTDHAGSDHLPTRQRIVGPCARAGERLQRASGVKRRFANLGGASATLTDP